MRTFLIGLVLALAWAASASAGVSLRQNADGSASWVTTGSGYVSSTPAGQHQFTVEIADLTTASTEFVVLPFGGRLHSLIVHNEGTFVDGSPEIVALIMAGPATNGNTYRNQFTPVEEASSTFASGFALTVPLSYVATGLVTELVFGHTTNGSLDFTAGSVIAIHNNTGSAGNAGIKSMQVTISVK